MTCGMKQMVLDAVEDTAQHLLIDARLRDEELPRTVIELAIHSKIITVDEIVEHFRKHIEKSTEELCGN